MVNRRQVLTGFLSIPAVVFANRLLAHQQVATLTFPPEAGPRALWGQAMLGGVPYGEPFLMEALPAAKGLATLRNTGIINLPPAPRSGTLEVAVYSAEYGLLGRSPIQVTGPIVAGCDVAITTVVFGKE